MKEHYEQPALNEIAPVTAVQGLVGDSQYNDSNDEGDD